MADLIPRGRRAERGQLLLIAAFIIATSFVVLALVVNSAIFTENLATRDDVPGSQDALQHRHEVEQSIGSVLREINGNESIPANPTTVDENVEEIQLQGGLQQSTRGRVVDVELDSTDPGTKVAQDAPRNFSNSNAGAADWVVAEDVNHTRDFRITVTDHDELTNPTNGFQVTVNGSNDRLWNLTIADAGTLTDRVEVVVDPPNAPEEQCTREFDGSMEIGVTGASVDGEPCVALDRNSAGTPMWFAAGVDRPYRIEYRNVDKIEGTYSTILGDNANVDTFLVPSYPTSEQPYQNTALYNVTVSYSYHTTSVGYDTTIRVAPGKTPP